MATELDQQSSFGKPGHNVQTRKYDTLLSRKKWGPTESNFSSFYQWTDTRKNQDIMF